MKPLGIIEFAEAFFMLETGTPIRLEPWQKAKVFAPLFEDRDPATGLRRYDTALVSLPKKNGKSTMAAIVAAYMLLADGEPDVEVYGTAGDQDQAHIVFNQTAKAIRRSPHLAREVLIQKDAIVRKDGGGVYRVLTANAPTAHGLNAHCVIWDELWVQHDYALWEALTHSPARKQPLHFIVTYAGTDQRPGEVPLWDLYQRGCAGTDPKMYMFWTEENLASWVTPAYLASQRQRLPDHVYRRLHANQWSTGTGNFFDLREWDACVDPEGAPLPPNRVFTMALGVDASTKRDRTSIVGVVRDGTMAGLVFRRTWQPSLGHPLDFEATIEATLLQVAQDYMVGRIFFDPYQLAAVAQRLQRAGLPMQEYPQTVPNLEAMAQTLFDRVKFRTLAMYRDDDLRTEASHAVALETANGRFRLSKEKSKHKIDSIVALAMALMALGEVPTIPAEDRVMAFPGHLARSGGMFEMNNW